VHLVENKGLQGVPLGRAVSRAEVLARKDSIESDLPKGRSATVRGDLFVLHEGPVVILPRHLVVDFLQTLDLALDKLLHPGLVVDLISFKVI